MLKSIGAVVVAVVAWFLTAEVGNLLIRGGAPRLYRGGSGRYYFTLPMKLCRLAPALVASLFAGSVCAVIAGPNSHAAKVLGCGLLLLFLPVQNCFGISSRCGSTYSFSLR